VHIVVACGAAGRVTQNLDIVGSVDCGAGWLVVVGEKTSFCDLFI